MSKFRLDKKAFKMGKQDEDISQVDYWLNKTILERLEASWFLTCHAYGLDYRIQHKIDKDYFKPRKRQ